MKFSYWLELPMAISTLLGSYNTIEDLELAKHLLNTSKAMELLTIRLEKEIDKISLNSDISSNNIEELTKTIINRLNNLEKEKSLIIIQSIKFSIKLASKFLRIIEENCINVKTKFNCMTNFNLSNVPDHFTLTKIKYFLSLIKNILTQLNYYLDSKNYKESSQLYTQEPEIQFCCIIKIFFEKIESKLFNISVNFLSNLNKQNNAINSEYNNNNLNNFSLNNNSNNSNNNNNNNNMFSNVIIKPNSDNDFYSNMNNSYNNTNNISNKKRANSMWVRDTENEEDETEIFSTPQIKLLRLDN